ncbi:MAG: hypothetical protein ACPGUG_16405 [Pseudoalteromonas marina]
MKQKINNKQPLTAAQLRQVTGGQVETVIIEEEQEPRWQPCPKVTISNVPPPA